MIRAVVQIHLLLLPPQFKRDPNQTPSPPYLATESCSGHSTARSQLWHLDIVSAVNLFSVRLAVGSSLDITMAIKNPTPQEN